MTQKHTNNQTPKKPSNFGRKYGNQKKHKEKVEWINDMTRDLEGLEEGLKAEIHIKLLKKTKKYQAGKRQDMMEYMDSGSRNSPPFTTA